jgi:hypothetical protein
VQSSRLWAGRYSKFLAERRDQGVLDAQSLGSAALGAQQPHQRAPHFLIDRILDQEGAEPFLGNGLALGGQGEQYLPVQPGQGRPPCRRPLLIRQAGEQRAGIERQGSLQGRGVVAGQTGLGFGLEPVDIQHQIEEGIEGQAGVEAHHRIRGGAVGKGKADAAQHGAEVDGGALGILLGPEQLQDTVHGKPMGWFGEQAEQEQQALAAAKRGLREGPAVVAKDKAAKQPRLEAAHGAPVGRHLSLEHCDVSSLAGAR